MTASDFISPIAILLALAGCVPPPTVESLGSTGTATTHAYDGKYSGIGQAAENATCGQGYVPANWPAFLIVGGNNFVLTPYMGGTDIKGQVSDTGVLRNSRGRLGQIVDGRFRGGASIGGGCRHSYDLKRN